LSYVKENMIEKTFTITEITNKFLDWHDNLSLTQQLLGWGVVFYTLDKLSSKKVKYDIPIIPKPKPIPRKDYSELTKSFTRFMQGNVCNSCKQQTSDWDYHHKDGDRSNNRPSNCEALCPNCHAKKTRKSKKLF